MIRSPNPFENRLVTKRGTRRGRAYAASGNRPRTRLYRSEFPLGRSNPCSRRARPGKIHHLRTMTKVPATRRGRRPRPIESLRPADISAHPIWRFVSGDEPDETWVVPTASRRSARLSGRVIGTQVTLADGSRRWALLSNIDPDNPQLTTHFLSLSLFIGGKWFHLARYHDVGARRHGPRALAAALHRPLGKVFPMRYDLRPYVRSGPSWLEGVVDRSPRNRLTRAEIIALSVP